MRINLALQQLLAGSVWQNYQLISTQWPSRPSVAGGAPVLPFLANALTAGRDPRNKPALADFSFLLGKEQ